MEGGRCIIHLLQKKPLTVSLILTGTTAASSAVSVFDVFRSEAQNQFRLTVRLLMCVVVVKSEQKNPSAVVVVGS